MSGWFAMKRGIHEHPLFKLQPERLFVWSWIIATAAWKDTRQDANGTIITVKRGQLLTSYRQMSKATGVGVQVIRTLIDKLRDESAIDTVTNTGRLLITIRNYEKYQTPDRVDNTDGNTRATHEQHTKEQDNNSSYEGVSADPAKIMFQTGRKMLAAAGKTERQSGSILGRWRNEFGTEAVIVAIGRAQREGAIDPVAFIEGCLRQSKKASSPTPGETRIRDGKREVFQPFHGWMPEHV